MTNGPGPLGTGRLEGANQRAAFRQRGVGSFGSDLETSGILLIFDERFDLSDDVTHIPESNSY
jgi:hypothetical protein